MWQPEERLKYEYAPYPLNGLRCVEGFRGLRELAGSKYLPQGPNLDIHQSVFTLIIFNEQPRGSHHLHKKSSIFAKLNPKPFLDPTLCI